MVKNGKSGTDARRETVNYLVFAASLRAGSLNQRLADLAVRTLTTNGGVVDVATMAEFDCPSYNQDTDGDEGLPPGADALRRRLSANDAFVIVSPEYNASMPGVIKNAIDWVSRSRPQPFNAMHGLLMSASPSMVGGNRGLWSLRIPLEHLGARLHPDMFSLAQADQAFGDDGALGDPALAERFELTVSAFMDLVEAAKHYPCVKKTWIEFLGEQPNPATDRIEIDVPVG